MTVQNHIVTREEEVRNALADDADEIKISVQRQSGEVVDLVIQRNLSYASASQASQRTPSQQRATESPVLAHLRQTKQTPLTPVSREERSLSPSEEKYASIGRVRASGETLEDLVSFKANALSQLQSLSQYVQTLWTAFSRRRWWSSRSVWRTRSDFELRRSRGEIERRLKGGC